MMFKQHLVACYATTSSIISTSLRRGHCSYSSTTAVAFDTKRNYSSSRLDNTSYQYHNRHGIGRVQHFGSKSFQQQFLNKNTKIKTKGSNSSDLLDDDNIKEEFEKYFKGKDNYDTNKQQEKDDDEEVADDYNYTPKNDVIESTSIEWIKKVVIGYNLCPFADKPLRENKLKVSVVRGDNDQHVAAAVVYELIARSDENQHGTTIVIAPEFYPNDFHTYMSLVQYIEEDVMDEHDLHGVVQIAPFHPQFEFEGSGFDGVDNYTNRSPYPMFHILRENEVAGAVDKLGGDASKVRRRQATSRVVCTYRSV